MAPDPDERWMRRALDWARRGEGLTRPNPPVGALVVRAGRCVGAGFHRRAGGPHAEVAALRAAGPRARGATLYVSLEPCSTGGRTPPCTDAIRTAGIARVVAATRDPNPAHRGRGLRLLRKAGVEVRCPVCAGAARELIAPFRAWITRDRPWLTLKLAATLDGRIADARGRARWISSPESRRLVQALRRRADAILVGAGTVRADNPSLLPRPAAGRRPWRVVVAGRGATPPGSAVWTDRHAARTLWAGPASGGPPPGSPAVQIPVPAPFGRADLPSLLRGLHARGLLHVVCEGGGQLAAALLEQGLVDEILWFSAPALLGGGGRPAVAGKGWALGAGPRLLRPRRDSAGPDLVIRARVAYPPLSEEPPPPGDM